MEKKIKIAELAKLWDVSVNATWARIKREKLITLKELDNNREISFVIVPEDILNKYLVNKGDNRVNNNDYEALLSNDNRNEPQETSNNNELFDKLITVNNNHNQQMITLYEELITYKSQVPLLEDRANREGLYLNEIKDLKEAINRNEQVNNRNRTLLITVIIALFLLLAALTGFLIYKLNNPTIIEKERVIEKLITPQPAPKTVKKR